MRLSNFLMWQSAYAELFFTDTLWPDIKKSEINDIINKFAKRKRRFGGI
ncbi:MAG: undecaprenyl diphosphate synthase family protein [Eubacteriales bacterium]